MYSMFEDMRGAGEFESEIWVGEELLLTFSDWHATFVFLPPRIVQDQFF